MKKQILIIFTAIYLQCGFTQNGDANSLEFDLNCKVTDQVVLTIKDGTPKRYSKYDDGPAIGEIFRLKFKFEYSQNSYKLNITTPNSAVGGFRIVLMDLKSTGAINQGNNFRFENGIYGSGVIAKSYISISSFLGNMQLERYFKNDWQLVGTGLTITEGTHILTANCLDMPETYNEIIKIIESVSGELK